MKTCPLGAQLFHADRRAYGHTDMTKLTVAFRNPAKAIKKGFNLFIFLAVYYVEMQGGTVILVFVSHMCALLLLDSYNDTFLPLLFI
jgi:hypothetical protein